MIKHNAMSLKINQITPTVFHIRLLLIGLLFVCSQLVGQPLQLKQFSTFNSLPTDEIQKVFQDADGLLWFASRAGLCKFDGHKITIYKSDMNSPYLLTNNNVTCIADDGNHNIWFGTQSGLNALDKKTGAIRQYKTPAISSNGISTLLKMRDNSLWVGTEVGLCRYNPVSDSFIIYGPEESNGIMSTYPIKSLYEDQDGDLWIGTWDSGLFRYSPLKNKFYSYPQFNERNSAHTIFQDSKGAMWVGTWDAGLYKINHPKEMDEVNFVKYIHQPRNDKSLSDNVVYDITEDRNTNSLWVGTRSGLSIMNLEKPGEFINYRAQSKDRKSVV